MRGSVGSARVWDDARRARSGADAPAPAAAPSTLPGPGLPPEEFRALVYGIVQVTLDTRLTECAPERRVELARELEQRLLLLFGVPLSAPAGAPAQTPPRAPPAEAAVPAPPAAPRVATPLPAPPSAPAALPPHARALALVLEDRLARLGGPLSERIELRQRLVELAVSSVPAQAEVEPEDASRDELRSLDVLQRRLAKLERSLGDTRATLAYVSGLERVDPGIASLYRNVQGLAHEDPRREQKESALTAIFQANLALQRQPRDQAPSG